MNAHDLLLGRRLHYAKGWLEHYHASDPHCWYSIVEDPNERGHGGLG